MKRLAEMTVADYRSDAERLAFEHAFMAADPAFDPRDVRLHLDLSRAAQEALAEVEALEDMKVDAAVAALVVPVLLRWLRDRGLLLDLDPDGRLKVRAAGTPDPEALAVLRANEGLVREALKLEREKSGNSRPDTEEK